MKKNAFAMDKKPSFYHEGNVVYTNFPLSNGTTKVFVVKTCNTEEQARAVASYYRLLARL